MNCQDFNDRLYDYLDDTLASDVQASVREHLRQCDDCRRVLLREKAVAQCIRRSLDVATAGLAIHPQTLRNVLAAWESKPIPPNALPQAWRWFILRPILAVSAGAAFLGALFVFLNLQAHRQPVEKSTSRAASATRQDTWIIDVPIPAESHLFRLQNGMVMDAITPSVATAHARFLELDNSAKPL